MYSFLNCELTRGKEGLFFHPINAERLSLHPPCVLLMAIPGDLHCTNILLEFWRWHNPERRTFNENFMALGVAVRWQYPQRASHGFAGCRLAAIRWSGCAGRFFHRRPRYPPEHQTKKMDASPVRGVLVLALRRFLLILGATAIVCFVPFVLHCFANAFPLTIARR